MKNYKLLLMIVLVIAFGCNKTTYPPYVSTKPSLPGKWYINKSVMAVYFYGDPVLQDTISTYTTKDYIQFNTDGTGFITDTLRGMPNRNFNYIYTPKDSTHVFLYQYLNTANATADTMTLTLFKLKNMSWQDSFTQVSIDLIQTNTYSYFFTKAD